MFGLPGLDLPLWDSLDVILYDLAGQYQPQREGDKMLLELVDADVVAKGKSTRFFFIFIPDVLGLGCYERFLSLAMYVSVHMTSTFLERSRH